MRRKNKRDVSLIWPSRVPLMVSPGTRIRLFADDCLIYRPINSAQDHVILQKDLNSVTQWANQWGMAFNTSKCNVLSTNSSSHRFYTMNDDILQEVDHATYRYLGISFSNDLTWGNHVANKAYQKLGFVRRNLQGASSRSKASAYTCLIRPGMEYAAPIWDPHLQKDINSLEKVQRKAARWAKSDYSPQSSVTTMMEDLKWEPLANRRKSAKLGLFHKIHHNNVELDFKRDFDLSYATRMTRACSSISADGHTSSHKLHRPRANKRPFQHATIVSTVPAWNSLSPEQIILPYTQFKKQLSSVRRP